MSCPEAFAAVGVAWAIAWAIVALVRVLAAAELSTPTRMSRWRRRGIPPETAERRAMSSNYSAPSAEVPELKWSWHGSQHSERGRATYRFAIGDVTIDMSSFREAAQLADMLDRCRQERDPMELRRLLDEIKRLMERG